MMKSAKLFSNNSIVRNTYFKTFFSSVERLVSMISVISSLADDWSHTSLSSFVSKLSSSTSLSNTLLELFTRTILVGGELDVGGDFDPDVYFLFNLSATVLQDSLITVRATD